MSEKHQCSRCAADPRPKHFGSPRNCAFTADGAFTPYNWNCATVSALFEAYGDRVVLIEGDDKSMEVCPVYRADDPGYNDGWIVLTRYKRRGCTSSATWVGDFWPPRAVTLDVVNQAIIGAPES